MSAARPLYRIAKDHVRALIETGRLGVGDRAPSEAELVAELGVSRMTANRALNELAEDGLLVREAGRGSFVADRRARGDLLALHDITEDLAARGHAHSMRQIERGDIAADDETAALFALPPGAQLHRVVVLHCQDGSPVLLEDRLIDADAAPGIDAVDFETTTTHDWLCALAPLHEVEHRIRAIAAGPNTASLLKIEPGAPCLEVRRRTFSSARTVSLARLIYAGERYEIAGRLERRDS